VSVHHLCTPLYFFVVVYYLYTQVNALVRDVVVKFKDAISAQACSLMLVLLSHTSHTSRERPLPEPHIYNATVVRAVDLHFKFNFNFNFNRHFNCLPSPFTTGQLQNARVDISRQGYRRAGDDVSLGGHRGPCGPYRTGTVSSAVRHYRISSEVRHIMSLRKYHIVSLW
jgi:hypothetical protein